MKHSDLKKTKSTISYITPIFRVETKENGSSKELYIYDESKKDNNSGLFAILTSASYGCNYTLKEDSNYHKEVRDFIINEYLSMTEGRVRLNDSVFDLFQERSVDHGC